MKHIYIFYVLLFSITFNMVKAQNQTYDQKVRAYIEKYRDWAIEEQQRVGIPASITLAQGVFETAAGESELAKNANNHFGIKCKKEWKGMTYAYTDDAPNECFRKYNSAKESYVDHSDYLKNSTRYAELWSHKPVDYKAWAKGLKKCGYATNPTYAQRLINVIENYDLQQYTLTALKSNNEIIPYNDKPQMSNISNSEPNNNITTQSQQNFEGGIDSFNNIFYINKLKAIYVKSGSTLLNYAIKHNIRYERLLEINELADEPLARSMYIFLEPKSNKGAHNTHVVTQGETIESIAQNEGMNSKHLRILNLLSRSEQPKEGAILNLQMQALDRPETYNITKTINNAKVSNSNNNYKLANSQNNSNDFIPTKKQNNTNIDEIEIGYGAEAPKTKDNTVAELSKSVDTLKMVNAQLTNQEAKTLNTNAQPMLSNTTKQKEPLDEIALLKQRLDKVVYTNSNIKIMSSDSAQVAEVNNVIERTNTNVSKNTSKPMFHLVRKGETVYGIAQKYGVSVSQINELNNLGFKGIIENQKLRVQ